MQGPVVAHIHVSTRQPEVVKYFLSIRIFSEPQQPLCGEEHARHVWEVHHHVGLVAVGEVDTPHGHNKYHYHHYIKHVSHVAQYPVTTASPPAVGYVLQMWVTVGDDWHPLPRHHAHVAHQLGVQLDLGTTLRSPCTML